MSALDKPLGQNELKAPPGHYRVVRMRIVESATDWGATSFLVEDFPARHDAIERWRDLSLAKRRTGEENLTYTLRDDEGRIVDAVGTHITEAERKAPAGKFRIICADINGTIRLVADLDDRDKAIEYAKNADEGPYTGFQVHDDTGAILIPLD